MSRHNDELRYAQQNKRSKDKANGTGSHFVSFHPTVAEKEIIKAADWVLGDAERFLEGALSRGLTVKFSLNQAGSAYCLVVAEAGKAYGEGMALAAFHADIVRLVQMGVYMLNVRWPDFPEVQPTASQLEFDW